MRNTLISISLYFIMSIAFFQLYGFTASAWVPRIFTKTEQEKITKEFPFNPDGIIKIKNSNGSVTIKTSAEQKISITITKSGTTEELKNTEAVFHVKPHEAVINTEYKQDQKTVIDYEIIIPKTSQLKSVNTQIGSITVEDFNGPIGTLKVEEGNIFLKQIKAPVHSLAVNKGNVTVINPGDALHNITVNRGNIDITDSINSVIAKTNRGSVTVRQKLFHEPYILFLESSKGTISVSIPQKTNAHVRLLTQRGSISSTFAITFKPITMKINNDSWIQLRRNVEGVIGNGGAPITIDVAKGNIVLDVY